MAELKRVLGFWTILSLAMASIMGTGMYFSVSFGSEIAGPSIVLAWAVLALIGLYIASFFGELSAMFPKAGGIYEFSKHAYSRFTSFLVGWTAWFLGNIGVALMIVGAINYVFPSPDSVVLKIIISIAFILLLNLIAYFGIEASAFLLVLFAALTFGLFAALIIPGSFSIHASNFHPFFALGIPSFFLAIFYLTESFFGWESVTYLAEETKDPEKVIPKALLWGTIIVGVLGAGSAFVSLGMVDWNYLSQIDAPLSFVSGELFGPLAPKLFTLGVFITLVGSAFGGIITMPRLLLALSRDKLFISQLSDIHPAHKTPYKAIIFQAILSIILFLMAFGRYEGLLKIMLPIGFILYIFAIFIVFKLRFTEPNTPRPFRVPFAKTGSIALISLMLLTLLLWVLTEPGAIFTLSLGISLILLGVPIYLLLEMYYDPDEIIRINDSLAYFSLWTENFILPKKVRNQILALLGDVREKTILEFGCSVGTLTSLLAEKVKPRGRVFATDLSQKEIMITHKRLLKKGHTHVFLIHDAHQVNRVHPSVPSVDAIVSIGMMGYLQDIQKVLTEMRELLPYGGKIVFVDYADFFKIIPNVEWLSDDKVIERMFRQAGFSVYVKREKGLFWNYVYVYGIKYQQDVPYV